jgi:hypothetical protein
MKNNQTSSNSNRPVLCSNNGICDNKQTCWCFTGWSGQYCDIQQRKAESDLIDLLDNKTLSSSIPSWKNRPFVNSFEITTTIAGFSLALLFAFLISLIFCK